MAIIKLSQGKRCNNSSGVAGVCWAKRHKKWRASYRRFGVQYYLGLFDTIQEAEKVLIASRGEVLTSELEALVSDEDYESLSIFAWHCSMGYAARNAVINGRRKVLMMHKVVAERMKLTGRSVDHANGNKLDNRRVNLRSADHSAQACNSKRSARNRSGVKGIDWSKQKKKWRARIFLNGKQRWSGFYNSLEDARRDREKHLSIIHGEFARC